jgi:hypothetical protein
MDSTCSGWDPVTGSVNTAVNIGSVKGGEFLDELSDSQHLRKDCYTEIVIFIIIKQFN